MTITMHGNDPHRDSNRAEARSRLEALLAELDAVARCAEAAAAAIEAFTEHAARSINTAAHTSAARTPPVPAVIEEAVAAAEIEVAELEAYRIVSAARARALHIEQAARKQAQELLERERRSLRPVRRAGSRPGWARLSSPTGRRPTAWSREGPRRGHGEPPSQLPTG